MKTQLFWNKQELFLVAAVALGDSSEPIQVFSFFSYSNSVRMSDSVSLQTLMSAQLASITVTFLREESATTHMARFFVTVAMVTVEKMVAIAKVWQKDLKVPNVSLSNLNWRLGTWSLHQFTLCMLPVFPQSLLFLKTKTKLFFFIIAPGGLWWNLRSKSMKWCVFAC